MTCARAMRRRVSRPRRQSSPTVTAASSRATCTSRCTTCSVTRAVASMTDRLRSGAGGLNWRGGQGTTRKRPGKGEGQGVDKAGYGLIETMRVRDGRIPFLDRHLARLARSVAELGLPRPKQDIAALVAPFSGTGNA